MGSPSVPHQCIGAILRYILFLVGIASAVASARLGNAAGEMLPGATGLGARVFMGRGMVVPPAPEDFLRRPAAVVRFAVGGLGTFEGQTEQTVRPGGSTMPITAVAPPGFVFDRWSDGVTANPRSVLGVMADMALTALFRIDGEFLTEFGAADVASGHGWWDLSGSYAASAAGNPLLLTVVHDSHGRLTGSATYTVGKATVVNLPVRGSVRGIAGNVALKIALKGTAPDRSVRVMLALDLALSAGTRQLVGPITGSVAIGSTQTPVAETLTLPIPAAMDGTWTLWFDLTQNAKGVTGTALLTLANGVDYVFSVQGRPGGATAVAWLSGDPADPGARGIQIRTTITPQDGGQARLGTFLGRGYGQTLGW